MKKRQNNTIKISVLVLVVSFFLLVGIALRTFQIAFFSNIDGVNLKKLASSRTTRKEVLNANRGTIYDSVGNKLAENVLSYTVIAYLDPKRSENLKTPQHVVNKKVTAKKLSPLINMSEEAILKLLNMDNAKQVELGPGGRGITELTKEAIENLKLPGIDFVESQKRYYSNNDFLSYVIGYAKTNDNNQINGELGLESYYNDLLKGKDGYLEYQKDRNGYKIPNTKEVRVDPISGKDVHLTIDSNIQFFVEDALRESFTTYDSEWITMIVAEAKTGKILASSSYPSFDPNIRNLTNYLDPNVSYSFEPGSTMKIFTYMAAMENNKYNGTDTFLSGSYKIDDDTTVNDWNQTGWGTINYDLGFALSSNVGVANIMQKYIDKKILSSYLDDLGFGKKTDITLPKEVSGKTNIKYKIEVVNAGFGQGITTTPIQNIQALTSIANNGMVLKPYIVEKIVDPTTKKIIYQGKKEELNKVASLKTVSKIKDLMYNVVNEDPTKCTGYIYKVDGLDIIGKTGTAQIADGKGGYLSGKRDYIKSFAGMYPKNDPQIIIYAAIKRPQEGSTTPLSNAVKKVIINTAKYLDINQVSEVKKSSTYVLPSFINKQTKDIVDKLAKDNMMPIVLGNGVKIINHSPIMGTKINIGDKIIMLTDDVNIVMPNITGWSSKDVISLCNLLNIQYEFNGYGYVTKQSIVSGTLVNTKDKLVIDLNPKYNLQD
jgi:penicillin-binding protein 2B